MKTILFIDGENFRKKLKFVFEDNNRKVPKWHEYNFSNLLDKALAGIQIEEKFFYFAKIKEHPKTIKKSKELIEEQRKLKTHLENQGFDVILSGQVRGQEEEDYKGKKNLVFKEKGVDVKIAVDMVSLSCDGKVSRIILASSDSDLQPAIKEVKKRGIKCIYVGFETGINKGLSFTTDKTILIRDSEVLE